MKCPAFCHELFCSGKIILEASLEALVDLLQALLDLGLSPLSLHFELLLLAKTSFTTERISKKVMQFLQSHRAVATVFTLCLSTCSRPTP